MTTSYLSRIFSYTIFLFVFSISFVKMTFASDDHAAFVSKEHVEGQETACSYRFITIRAEDKIPGVVYISPDARFKIANKISTKSFVEFEDIEHFYTKYSDYRVSRGGKNKLTLKLSIFSESNGDEDWEEAQLPLPNFNEGKLKKTYFSSQRPARGNDFMEAFFTDELGLNYIRHTTKDRHSEDGVMHRLWVYLDDVERLIKLKTIESFFSTLPGYTGDDDDIQGIAIGLISKNEICDVCVANLLNFQPKIRDKIKDILDREVAVFFYGVCCYRYGGSMTLYSKTKEIIGEYGYNDNNELQGPYCPFTGTIALNQGDQNILPLYLHNVWSSYEMAL